MLKCSRCKEELPEESFYVSRTTKRGFTSYCKKCLSEYQREHNRKIHAGCITQTPRLDEQGNLVKPRGGPINYRGSKNLWRSPKVDSAILWYLAEKNTPTEMELLHEAMV